MLKHLILAAAAAGLLFAHTSMVKADAVNNLTIGVLSDAQVVPQSASDPCIICATTQAHNPVGFGYNNFDSTGNDSSFNLFSSNITGAFGNGDDITVTPYTSGELRNFLASLGFTVSFGVAIDINTAATPNNGKTPETLEEFRLIDLDLPAGQRVIFDIDGPIALPDIRNGNGTADYLISGFDLSSVGINDRLLFQASWDHATDGGESFYIIPIVTQVEVPEPRSLAIFGTMLLMLWGAIRWARRHPKNGHSGDNYLAA
jgi:hypothetical protein